jgi:transposase
MSTAPAFIGIDVGYRMFSAAISGVRPRDFSHDSTGIVEMLRWIRLREGGELRAVCESSGPYSAKLAMLLDAAGVSCAIVPPQRVRANAKALGRLSKTDRIDAQVILDYAMHVQPSPWLAPPPEQARLKALMQARTDLQTEARRWSNRLHSLELLPHTPAELLELPLRMNATLQEEQQKLNAAIDKLLAAATEMQQRFALLTGIPGIGRETALALLARADILLTRSDKELTAYAGLAPSHKTSGSSIRGRSQLPHSGDAELRKALYMASLSAAQHNPPLRDFYARLRAAGKSATHAHCAVARKLLLQARSVMLSGRPFDPNLSQKRS